MCRVVCSRDLVLPWRQCNKFMLCISGFWMTLCLSIGEAKATLIRRILKVTHRGAEPGTKSWCLRLPCSAMYRLLSNGNANNFTVVKWSSWVGGAYDDHVMTVNTEMPWMGLICYQSCSNILLGGPPPDRGHSTVVRKLLLWNIGIN